MLVFPSAFANKHALVRTIKKSGLVQFSSEGRCIVCKSSDPTKLALKLAGLPGIDSFAIATKTSSRFSDVIRAIVRAGSRAVQPKDKFYVKVIQTAKADYVDRDVEFASSGTLAEKLAGIGARPAKSEQEADCVILAVAGKMSAYVCVKDAALRGKNAKAKGRT